MYVLKNPQTGYLSGFGTGIVASSQFTIFYPAITPEGYKALIQALPEWGGDWRMVVLDGEGFPLSYTPRSLTAEEQEADERADLFDKAQQLLSQIDATVASHQAIVDDWETLTTGEQIAHLNTLTQVQIKELQVLKYFIKKGL